MVYLRAPRANTHPKMSAFHFLIAMQKEGRHLNLLLTDLDQ